MRSSLINRIFGRFSPSAAGQRQQEDFRIHLNPLSRNTALFRVRGWDKAADAGGVAAGDDQEGQIPTEEVALVDLDDLWTVVQPEVRFDPIPDDGLLLSRSSSMDNEAELKEGLVLAEGGQVVMRANSKHHQKSKHQQFQSSLDVIEPSRIKGDDDGFLIVDDALVDHALADFLAQLFMEHRNRHVRNLTPDQLKSLVQDSMERVAGNYDEGTWASLWRWAKLLYTVYGWGSTALSLYHRPFLVRLGESF